MEIKKSSLAKKLNRKLNQRPSKRQITRLKKMTDVERKKQREEHYNELEEEIRHLHQEIKRVEKLREALAFEYEDLKSDMKRKNMKKLDAELLSIALLEF